MAEAIKRLYDSTLDFYEDLEQDYETTRNELSKKDTELKLLTEKTKTKWIPYILQCIFSIVGTFLLTYGINLITSCMFTKCTSDLNGQIPSIIGVILILISLLIPISTNLGGRK